MFRDSVIGFKTSVFKNLNFIKSCKHPKPSFCFVRSQWNTIHGQVKVEDKTGGVTAEFSSVLYKQVIQINIYGILTNGIKDVKLFVAIFFSE